MSDKFERMLRILSLLDSGLPCTVEKIMDEFQVSDRTVYRYLKHLHGAGFPIYFNRERGTYAFTEGYTLKKVPISPGETLVLALARKFMAFWGHSFEDAFGKLEEKVMACSKNARGQSAHFMLPAQRPGYSDLSPLIQGLAGACTERRIVEITYRVLYSDERTQRQVEPHYLFFSTDGFWNLRGWCRMREDWRVFALDRIEEWQVLDRYFMPRLTKVEQEQDLEGGFDTFLDGEPIDVMVRFSETIGPYVRRRKWHPSQEVRELEDGRIEVRFRTTGTEALKYWLYRWLPHIEEIQPDELRIAVVDELKQQTEALLRCITCE